MATVLCVALLFGLIIRPFIKPVVLDVDDRRFEFQIGFGGQWKAGNVEYVGTPPDGKTIVDGNLYELGFLRLWVSEHITEDDRQ